MLGGNQYKKDSSRLVWNVAASDKASEDSTQTGHNERAIPAITLKPMEIRSFILSLSRN